MIKIFVLEVLVFSAILLVDKFLYFLKRHLLLFHLFFKYNFEMGFTTELYAF